MRKVLVVAVREYIAAVKSKAFVITLVLMPVLMSLGIVAETFIKEKVDLNPKRLAVVDHSGVLYDDLVSEARRRNTEDIFAMDENSGLASDKQVLPEFHLERVDPAGLDRDELLLKLSDRVRAGALFAFAEIGRDALDPPADGSDANLIYYSNTPTYREMWRWLRDSVTRVVQQWRFTEAGLDRQKVVWALQPTEVEQFSLFARDESTGAIAAEKVDEMATFVVPVIMLMLMFVVIMIGSTPLIQSVLEEKSQRIAEVLLSSLTPFQWMMGKLVGMVGVSFTIVVVYMTGALIVADRYDAMQLVPFHLLGWFYAYQTLAVLMFGAVFVAVGAACTDHREAQSAIMPVMIVIVLPMMLWVNVAREPGTTFSTLVSLFPPATPMLMLVRQAVPPGIPVWQPALGIALVLLTTLLCVFAAGRIFRVGILMQGKGAGFRDVVRWIARG